MIHSARSTVTPVASIVFNLFCFARFWNVWTDGRTDDMYGNNDLYRPWLWVGRVDQKPKLTSSPPRPHNSTSSYYSFSHMFKLFRIPSLILWQMKYAKWNVYSTSVFRKPIVPVHVVIEAKSYNILTPYLLFTETNCSSILHYWYPFYSGLKLITNPRSGLSFHIVIDAQEAEQWTLTVTLVFTAIGKKQNCQFLL